MVCGHREIRMLNLLTIGRMYDDDLIIDAASAMCAECDPAKAERREYQYRSMKSMAWRLSHGKGPEVQPPPKLKAVPTASPTAPTVNMACRSISSLHWPSRMRHAQM